MPYLPFADVNDAVSPISEDNVQAVSPPSPAVSQQKTCPAVNKQDVVSLSGILYSALSAFLAQGKKYSLVHYSKEKNLVKIIWNFATFSKFVGVSVDVSPPRLVDLVFSSSLHFVQRAFEISILVRKSTICPPRDAFLVESNQVDLLLKPEDISPEFQLAINSLRD